MNWKQDAWKAGLALVAIATAVASHKLALPPSLTPYAGGIESLCGAIVIGAAVFINKPNS